MKKPKKKKVNLTSLCKKADKLFSEHWRKRLGKCERCGKRENLQLAHIVTRSCRFLRFKRHNTFVLCAGCHLWGHRHPLLFADFVKENKTQGVVDLLNKQITEKMKTTPAKFYQSVIDDIQECNKKRLEL